MPKKKVTTAKKSVSKKKVVTKKTVTSKKSLKTEKKITPKKKVTKADPTNFLQKENEDLLISLISKEFDKELTKKSETYIKSYVKIEDATITVNDFLNYIENLDEDLFKLFKAYSNSSDNDTISSSDDSEEEEKTYKCKK